MCDIGENETVGHVALEYENYDRDNGNDACDSILTEMGPEMNEVIERTGKEWMMLVGLCGETSRLHG